MGRFGQSVAESANSDTWINGFKDGVTRIRIAQEVPTWVKFTQHFSKIASTYFPHDKDAGAECVGCKYPEFFNDKGEPKQQVQYAFNAFDDQGKLRIYRLGTDAYKILKSRHDRMSTVTDRDFNIVRTGKGLDTSYFPEAGDKYAVDIPEAGDLLDIYNALESKYEEAKRKIEAHVKAEAEEGRSFQPEPDEDKPARAKEPEDEAQNVVINSGENWTETVNFEDMSTPDIKAWIEEHPKGEVPPRAGRAALVKIAEELTTVPRF